MVTAARAANPPGRGLVREFVLFFASTTAYQVARLGINIVAAAVLPVAVYGAWGLVVVILT